MVKGVAFFTWNDPNGKPIIIENEVNNLIITCFICEDDHEIESVGISVENFNFLNSKKIPGIAWICNLCQNKPRQDIKSPNDKYDIKLEAIIKQLELMAIPSQTFQKETSEINNKVTKLENAIELRLQSLEEKLMGKVDAQKNHLSRNFKSYAETVTKKIENENNDLNKKFDVVASTIEHFENSAIISDINTNLKKVKVNIETKMVKDNESLIKTQKQCNVCVFNVPEGEHEKDEENYKQDVLKLKTILNEKIVIDKQDIKSIYRIGVNKNSSRPRPLIIKFTNIEKRNEAIQLTDLIYTSGKNEDIRIFIQPDKTKKEIEQHKILIQQLRERRANGEENIVIRNGKIISLAPFRLDPSHSGDNSFNQPDFLIISNCFYLNTFNHPFSYTPDVTASITQANSTVDVTPSTTGALYIDFKTFISPIVIALNPSHFDQNLSITSLINLNHYFKFNQNHHFDTLDGNTIIDLEGECSSNVLTSVSTYNPSRSTRSNSYPLQKLDDVELKGLDTLLTIPPNTSSVQVNISGDSDGLTPTSKSSPIRNNIKVGYFNARSIVNKVIYLKNMIETASYDVVFIVETWLSPSVPDVLICPRGFDVIRRDRCYKKGGGLLVLYRSYLPVVEIRDYICTGDSYFEYLSIDMLFSKKNDRIRFMCVYLPPDKSGVKTIVKNLCNCLKAHGRNDLYYVLGDFNFPFIDWMKYTSKKPAGKCFLNFCVDTSLTQRILESTTVNESLLDLVLCNEISGKRLQSVEVLPPLTTTCDHSIIQLVISCTTSENHVPKVPTRVCYERGNYSEINAHLETIDWPNIFLYFNRDIQKIYDYFLDYVHKLISTFVPTARVKKNSKQPRHLLRMAKQKKQLYKKKQKDDKFNTMYKNISNRYKAAVDQWYNSIETKVCHENNNSSFYKYANEKLKSFESIPPLKTEHGDFTMNDQEKAELLNKTFHSVFTKDDGNKLDLDCKVKSNHILTNIIIDPQMVSKALSNLCPKKSQTPDKLPCYVIKKIGKSITGFLCLLYNLSIQTNQIPSQWKTAIITPVFKKGSRNRAINYRPISLTSAICRILEHILHAHLLNHLYDNNLISLNQHGFLPKRSTITQLLDATNKWKIAYEANRTTYAVYTNLSKAFDKVCHSKLLTVIESFGISGTILDWIRNFLAERIHKVTIGEAESCPMSVLSGVPQGSVIGPLMFLLYIDDISMLCSEKTSICLFADDTKLFSSDPKDLQKSLNAVSTFLKSRQLHLAEETKWKRQKLKRGRKSKRNNHLMTLYCKLC